MSYESFMILSNNITHAGTRAINPDPVFSSGEYRHEYPYNNGIYTSHIGNFQTYYQEWFSDAHVSVTMRGYSPVQNYRDNIKGGDGADVIWGSAGNDDLDGRGGNDILVGGLGEDFINGGEGDDLIIGGIDIKLSNANNFLEKWQDILLSYLSMTPEELASKFTITNKSQSLSGDNGNDIVISGNGDDHLGEDTGNDVIYAGGGNDEIFGDNALDTVGGNDPLYGEEGNDFLYGGAGDDLLVGNGGYDFIDGGAGNDTYLLGTGSGYDHIFEAANGGTDNLYVVGLTEVGIYKQGNHLLIAANDDVMVLDSWYVNHGVEYIDFGAAQTRYLVSDLANMAVEIQSFGLAEGADMSQAGGVEPITVQGISALDIPVLA